MTLFCLKNHWFQIKNHWFWVKNVMIIQSTGNSIWIMHHFTKRFHREGVANFKGCECKCEVWVRLRRNRIFESQKYDLQSKYSGRESEFRCQDSVLPMLWPWFHSKCSLGGISVPSIPHRTVRGTYSAWLFLHWILINVISESIILHRALNFCSSKSGQLGVLEQWFLIEVWIF